jgi:hypothetical protein
VIAPVVVDGLLKLSIRDELPGCERLPGEGAYRVLHQPVLYLSARKAEAVRREYCIGKPVMADAAATRIETERVAVAERDETA